MTEQQTTAKYLDACPDCGQRDIRPRILFYDHNDDLANVPGVEGFYVCPKCFHGWDTSWATEWPVRA